jgi:DNA-binding transcriptional regulator YdaS (Cro superfamily)
MRHISAQQRKQFAAALGVGEQYLYQCLTGRRDMGAADARRAEAATNQMLRRWHLRQRDWHLIWPELIGTSGAPAVACDEASHDDRPNGECSNNGMRPPDAIASAQ